MKLLVLYEELAPYFISCISTFSERYNCDVLIIRKPINAVAPFDEAVSGRLEIIDRNTLTDEQLIQRVNKYTPDAIFCGGWSYKPYLNIAKQFSEKIPVVLGFDNWWTGSWKQQLLSLGGKRYFRNRFNRCYVPGKMQKELARQLGFDDSKISTGAYSGNYDHFHSLYVKYRTEKAANYPKRFLFVGRYAPEKGIEKLWEAFISLQSELNSEWELWCVGKGDIAAVQHDKIKHFGFVQPAMMESLIQQCGVFVLPSTFEPWGVVVHEFAAAGFPMILSNKVGAAETFLESGTNGVLFDAGNSNELKAAMRSMILYSDSELVAMGDSSAQLAERITPAKWAENLYNLINN